MTRTIDFRYRVLRDGAVFGELHAPASGGPSLRMSASSEIKTALSGSFAAAVTSGDGRAVTPDWLRDEIQPVMILDGIEHALGVYLPATVTDTRSNGVQQLQIQAYDRCWRVRDTYSESVLHFAAGLGYLEAVEQLLTACGISLVIATPTDAVLSEAREDWAVGTSYLDIVNELLGEINYNPLWFNAAGAAVLEPASVPTAENIRHTLDSSNVASLLLPTITRETDVYSAPNVFVVLCSNPDKSGPMVATAENDNPQSPLSIMRRGRRIVKYTRVNNIASQAELQAYADRLRNESLITGETVRVSTALLPGFGVADVIGLHYGELSAICIERAWTMELRVGGTMTHEMERVVVNLG